MEPDKVTAQKKRLGDFLVENGLLDPKELEKALQIQRNTGKKLGEILVESNLITESQVTQTLAFQLGYKVIDLKNMQINPEVFFQIPKDLAIKHQVIPVHLDERVLTVAMADPLDYECISDLAFSCGFDIVPVLAPRREIVDLIEQQNEQPRHDRRLGDILKESEKDFSEEKVLQVIPEISPDGDEAQSLEERSRLAPIIRLANVIISNGIKDRASDIHIEPGQKECRIRYRVDGILKEGMQLPYWAQGPLISRIKILASLDISNRRHPQDGAVRIKIEDAAVDLRVSVLPSKYGEKIVIRILDQSNVLIELESLGLSTPQFSTINSLIQRKKGIILVTGPTGSGKSTTLYALINKLKSEKTNLMTVEDPIEYSIEGVSQVQTNPAIDLTFAKCLRAILRQDPNIILIGEIRDRETAEIAFRAAMTGHLVLSTLHTNDAPSTISRLIDIGIPRYLVSTQLVGIIAQRLIRSLCQHCKKNIPFPEDELRLHKIPSHALNADQLFIEKGCSRCSQEGFRGRVGIYEILEINPALRELIALGLPEQQIRAAALSMGMMGLREAGLEKVKEGVTSLSELERVIEIDDQLQSFCQKCAKSITIEYLACPYCGEAVTSRCQSCGKPNQPDWNFCPFCRHKTENQSEPLPS